MRGLAAQQSERTNSAPGATAQIAGRAALSGGSKPPIAVVGAGLGGLSAAIRLRTAGHDVVVYESNALSGGRANRIEREGFRFDTGPSLVNYPWVFKDLFAAAGRRFEDYVTLNRVEPSLAFQWPDGTCLTLSSDVARLRAELERLEPGCGPGLMRFLRDAGAKYDLAFRKLVNRNADTPWAWMGGLGLRDLSRLSLWRSLYGELGKFFKSRYIREAFGAYGMYLGGSPYELPGFFSILAYGELAYGLWLPKGGVYGLADGMARLARELGVELRLDNPVARIDTMNGRVTGLTTAAGLRHETAALVSNVDAPTTDTVLLAHEPRIEKRRGAAQRLRMTPGVITFYWGVQGRLNNLGHHTIFLPQDYRGAFTDLMKRGRIPIDLPFYISIASETDPSLAPQGCSSVFVLVPAPLLSQIGPADWESAVAAVRTRVLERLARHGVPLSESRIRTETVYTPVDWRDRFGLYDGSAFGAAHGLFQLGPFRPRNWARELSGLYYTGASTTPGTGMPMVVLSGALTAERIAAHVR